MNRLAVTGAPDAVAAFVEDARGDGRVEWASGAPVERRVLELAAEGLPLDTVCAVAARNLGLARHGVVPSPVLSLCPLEARRGAVSAPGMTVLAKVLLARFEASPQARAVSWRGGETALDLARLAPIPEEVRGAGYHYAGFAWCLRRWGTAANARAVRAGGPAPDPRRPERSRAVYLFDTVGAPPDAALRAASLRHPGAVLVLAARMPRAGFSASYLFHRGAVAQRDPVDAFAAGDGDAERGLEAMAARWDRLVDAALEHA